MQRFFASNLPKQIRALALTALMVLAWLILGMVYGFVGINVQRLEPESALPAEPLAEVPLVVQDR